ncbi:DUF3099 domain-containing protein [Streptomyces sp. NPDC056160]|uniref:DUF3099 domain-containing protein n=1 Tax=Streptomyces sp. NPDC056160 TaxID=3345731 RepID=UPI0035DAEEEB
MRKQHGGGGVEVFRITGARTGLQEDVRGRQRRYVISMSIRTLAVLLAVALWNVERYVAIAALVLGAALPYIAVVIANAGRENAPGLPSTFVTMPTKPMITSPRTADAGSGEAFENGPGEEAGSGSGEASPEGSASGFAESVAEDAAGDPAADTAGAAREHRNGV